MSFISPHFHPCFTSTRASNDNYWWVFRFIKRGACSRWSSSLYCPVRNSDKLPSGRHIPLYHEFQILLGPWIFSSRFNLVVSEVSGQMYLVESFTLYQHLSNFQIKGNSTSHFMFGNQCQKESDPTCHDSVIEWWISRSTQNRFKFKLVLYRIRRFPTLISKIKCLGPERFGPGRFRAFRIELKTVPAHCISFNVRKLCMNFYQLFHLCVRLIEVSHEFDFNYHLKSLNRIVKSSFLRVVQTLF